MPAKRNYTHAIEILNNGAWWEHLCSDVPYENSPAQQDLQFAIQQATGALSFLAEREERMQRCSDLEAIRELEANIDCVELDVTNHQAGVPMESQKRFIDAAKIAIEAIWTLTNDAAPVKPCQNNQSDTRSISQTDMKMLGEVIYDITTVASQHLQKIQDDPHFDLDTHDSRVLYQSIYDWACEFEFDGYDQEDYMLTVEEFANEKLFEYFKVFLRSDADVHLLEANAYAIALNEVARAKRCSVSFDHELTEAKVFRCHPITGCPEQELLCAIKLPLAGSKCVDNSDFKAWLDSVSAKLDMQIAIQRQNDYVALCGGMAGVKEGDDTFNNFNREIIDAFAKCHSNTWIGSLTVSEEDAKAIASGEKSVLRHLPLPEGKTVENFSCNFCVPGWDNELIARLKAWILSHSLGVPYFDENPTLSYSKLMDHIKKLGGYFFIWR